MADHHSTRECVRCGIPFPVKTGRGRKPLFCGDECRRLGRVATTGTKHGTRVERQCAWCDEPMLLTPSRAAKQTTCSKSCANHLRAQRAGKQPRKRSINCAGCHRQVARLVRSGRDAAKYCSRECAFDVLARVSKEREALRRISGRKRKKQAERYRTVVLPEIQALHRIARYVNHTSKIGCCPQCGSEYRRSRKYQRYCSTQCRHDALSASAQRYRDSEACRQQRRTARARRRARIRNVASDAIDPIQVFERDKWRCHLCGIKTPKRLRGTRDDRAPELEHIISLADGGSHTWGNVACSCRKCNHEKGAESRGQLGLAIA